MDLTIETVQNYYEKWTNHYISDFGDVFQALQTENPQDLIDYICDVAEIKDGQRILDAGCGVGGPAIRIAKNVDVHIEALNISKNQIDIARDNLRTSDIVGAIDFVEGDFHKIEERYDRDSFDRVLFLESLVHSNNPLSAIAASRAVLKKGGILYIKDLFEGPKDPENRGRVEYPISKINEQFALKIRPLGEMIQNLTESGFEIIGCQFPKVQANFDRGNRFTARHGIRLVPDQEGPWEDRGFIFLSWIEIICRKVY